MSRNPFQELLALQERMNRMFEESMRSRSVEDSTTGVWSPAVDVYETADSLILKVELPEVRREDLEIRLEGGALTLRGERKINEDLKKHTCLRRECQYGVFSRTLNLPAAVDPDRIQAQYKDGVVWIQIPKQEASEPRHIEIA